MGNTSSVNKINYEDLIFLSNQNDCILINTLPPTMQDCLIINTTASACRLASGSES